MQAEKDIKKAAGICLEKVALDPEMYRLGHTKARNEFPFHAFSMRRCNHERLIDSSVSMFVTPSSNQPAQAHQSLQLRKN